MNNVIPAIFDPQFRHQVFLMIKHKGGPQFNERKLIEQGYHPSFIKALVRNITKKEGW